ncbi:MAG: sigma-54-dependent Fis family transcriptional regulator [Planctomycetaceae bacterium]|nr:sigma-54-dependent Fis family transcriptional regulator [Planctomycetaceae bacterium]
MSDAYLVIRVGSKWTDFIRLIPGRTATIGRTSTNLIVIKDESCSRNHAEVFHSRKGWQLRDLESRNGTHLNGEPISGDRRLTAGDMIRIAQCQLAFVHNPQDAFKDDSHELITDNTTDGEPYVALSDSNLLPSDQPTTITHRREQTRFLHPATQQNQPTGTGPDAEELCRLVFQLVQQTDPAGIAQLALEGLFASTKIDAGALLLLSPDHRGKLHFDDLKIAASRSDTEFSYHRVSPFLATTALKQREAVLARNVADDPTLGTPDSKGEIHSTSDICAPIRYERTVLGLVHLYSTAESRTPDTDDLEFTLAVADNVAQALINLHRQAGLVEDLSQSRDEVTQLRRQLRAKVEIIGSSPLLNEVHNQIAQAAPSRATVLIRGESGVGKELVARAVHYASPRQSGPFVCLNCAALSETLLESELFGHEKGAFTGATERKAGKFETASEGTLMLDEIGEMSPKIQAKFLRVLEGHPFERVGGSEALSVDVRMIAATNRDLEKAVADGSFRRDLYFRLNVVDIEVPPLRKRREDISDLAEFFLEQFNRETGKPPRTFTDAARQQLQTYHWPGNVRELRNVIERAVLLTAHEAIGPEDLKLSWLQADSESGEIAAPLATYVPESLADIERRHIQATLESFQWNKSRSAATLGIERSTLDRKIDRYGLKSPYKKQRRS